jgi:hypothetical protein
MVGKDLHLTEARAIPLVRDHKPDSELFNVTGLVVYGYDDAHMSSIPCPVATRSSEFVPEWSEYSR